MTCEGFGLDTRRKMPSPELKTCCGSSSVTDLSTSLRIIAISMPRKKRLMSFQVIMMSNAEDVGATGGRQEWAVGIHPHNPRWPSGDNRDRNAIRNSLATRSIGGFVTVCDSLPGTHVCRFGGESESEPAKYSKEEDLCLPITSELIRFVDLRIPRDFPTVSPARVGSTESGFHAETQRGPQRAQRRASQALSRTNIHKSLKRSLLSDLLFSAPSAVLSASLRETLPSRIVLGDQFPWIAISSSRSFWSFLLMRMMCS